MTTNGSPDPPLSLKDAATRLGISPHTLRTWAKYQRRVPFYRLGRRLLFDPADVAAFKAAGRIEAQEEGRR